jgi:succinylarginine dihydrolase
MREINFDGLVGPSHNYAGLSFGNVASAANAGAVSAPRAAALQGLAKMRRLIELGLPQGILFPHNRPNADWLRRLGFTGTDREVCAAAYAADPALFRNAFSASAMWTANAATISPAPDTADGRCHLTVANLSTMLHRAMEPEQTLRQLQIAFADGRHFSVHGPLPSALGDEGAANFMRLASRHAGRGLEIFVYGEQRGSGFPARQHRAASQAVARRHNLSTSDRIFIRQSDTAIASGAFHNDVVAVANENVLFTHEQAFEDRETAYAAIRARVYELVIVEAPAARISLSAAVRTYLFNCQLVTVPDDGMCLIIPAECRDIPEVWTWLGEVVESPSPITRLEVVDIRESMRNGGGPACLRLRVAVDDEALAAIDPRFLLDHAKCAKIEKIVATHWPEQIAPSDLGDPELWEACWRARRALLDGLGFVEGEL